MTKAKGEIGLETMAGRQKLARMSLLMKFIADNTESSAVVIRDGFSELVTNNIHDYIIIVIILLVCLSLTCPLHYIYTSSLLLYTLIAYNAFESGTIVLSVSCFSSSVL